MYEATSNTIRSRFKVQVADVYSMPTQYSNQDADLPEGSLTCQFSIRFGERSQRVTGGGEHRTHGIAYAQLYVPNGDGDGTALAIVDAIITAFQEVTQSGVRFTTPRMKTIGNPKGSQDWLINVECPFWMDL